MSKYTKFIAYDHTEDPRVIVNSTNEGATGRAINEHMEPFTVTEVSKKLKSVNLFAKVMITLQGAEEMGGTADTEDYIALMDEIIIQCQMRKNVAKQVC